MNDDDLAKLTINTFYELLNKFDTQHDQSITIGIMMIACYNEMLKIEGQDFVIGWLESAMNSVKNKQATKTPQKH